MLMKSTPEVVKVAMKTKAQIYINTLLKSQHLTLFHLINLFSSLYLLRVLIELYNQVPFAIWRSNNHWTCINMTEIL